MLLENLFENSNQGFENLRKLISAQNARQPVEITVGGESLNLEYPEVNFLIGQYKAYNRAGRQEQFVKDLDDPLRFDAHMKKLRDLIDKQKNFQGSVPGQREVAEQSASNIIAMLESQLAEQDSRDPKVLGVSNLRMIEKTMNTPQPVTLEFSDGSSTVIDDPMEKKYFIAKMNAYNKKGLLNKYILDMGVSERFDFHVEQLANEYARLEMQKGVPAGGQQPPEQVQEIKKKARPEDIGSQDVVDPKLKAELIKARAENPAASSDLEAYLKSARTKFNRTSQDIDLVKDTNQQQQELLDKLVNFDREQRQELQQLDKENDDQEQEIDALQVRNQQLEKAVAAMAQTRQDMPTRRSKTKATADTATANGKKGVAPAPTTTAVPAMGTSTQGDISGVGLVGQQDLVNQPGDDEQVRDLFTQPGQGTTSVTKRRKEVPPAANQAMNPNLFTQLPAAESRVRVNQGQFKGKMGVVENRTADGFVMVVLEDFGRHTLHSSRLEPVMLAEGQAQELINRYLAIDAENDVEAVRAAIQAISRDPSLSATSKTRLLGQIGMIINRHRLPMGREYYQFMRQYMEGQDMSEGWSDRGNPTAYSVYIDGREWKAFANNDLARAVAEKVEANLKRQGRDQVVTIAPSRTKRVQEDFGMPGTTVPRKSVIQGYTVFFNPETKTVSVTRGGDSEEAAIEQARINTVNMKTFRNAAEKMIDRIETTLSEHITKEPRTAKERDDMIDRIRRMAAQERNPTNLQIMNKDIEMLQTKYRDLKELDQA